MALLSRLHYNDMNSPEKTILILRHVLCLSTKIAEIYFSWQLLFPFSFCSRLTATLSPESQKGNPQLHQSAHFYTFLQEMLTGKGRYPLHVNIPERTVHRDKEMGKIRKCSRSVGWTEKSFFFSFPTFSHTCWHPELNILPGTGIFQFGWIATTLFRFCTSTGVNMVKANC